MISRKEAKEQGLTRYFSGQTCVHGHTDERLTSTGACIICVAKYSKKWKIDNHKAKLVSCKRYYAENKELIVKKQKVYRTEQKEHFWQVRNGYIDAKREKVNAYKAAWKKRNLAKVTFDTVKRNTAKLHRTPAWLTDFDLLKMQCMYSISAMLTRENKEPWHVDHIIPLQGKNVSGLHVPSNLQVMRGVDNMKKNNQYGS